MLPAKKRYSDIFTDHTQCLCIIVVAAAAFDSAILRALMSPVGSDRTAAESAYTQMLAAPESCAAGLLGCLPAGAQPDEIRLMAAVMLRQLLDHARGHWARMSPQVH